MMHCLWCEQVIIKERMWSNFLTLEEKNYLCSSCEHQLEKIKGKTCKKCSRPFEDEGLCQDCKFWQKHYGVDPLEQNISVYLYNDFIKEVINRWKYRGDYTLVKIFKPVFKKGFIKCFPKELRKESIIVPIPLSQKRLIERGFNQAKALAQLLSGDIYQPLSRIHGEKQSKRTRKERLKTENPFSIIKQVDKSVILVDDLYTTGTTIRHAATILKEAGCPRIFSYTLMRGSSRL